MGNIKMEFKHPKYYKELRKLRNNLDQVISKQQATASSERSPGPGLEVQIVYQDLTGLKPQASSSKPQATKTQAASDKHQA